MMEAAGKIAAKADIFIVVGTSLVVYPAAGLVHYTDFTVPKYVIDPNRPAISNMQNVEYITEKASIGVRALVDRLMED
jgi:NAD-dependent deacetylase